MRLGCGGFLKRGGRRQAREALLDTPQRFADALEGALHHALVGIQPTDTGSNDEIADEIVELAEVESCYAVAGDEAFVVKVRVETVDELEHALGRLRRIDGVARTRTTVVLSTRFEGRPNNRLLDADDDGVTS